jgi:Lrp/AsnC family leucine-responsive transcriptional regulator
MKHHLDDTDFEILRLLQTDGRMTNVDLAKRVDLSPPSALQRVRILERDGYIKGYAAHLNPERLGFGVTVLAMISLSLHQDQPIETFRKSILEIDEVVECLHVSGEFDFLVKILVPDIAAYERLIRERISKITGIQQIKSSFVLANVKSTTAIPIRAGGRT